MNTIVVSTFRRPFHTRLCLESLARAQRWHPWAGQINICIAPNGEQTLVPEIQGIIGCNPDIPFYVWLEPSPMDPHQASKWMLDRAFAEGADASVYIEEDEIVSPDAFVLLEWTQRINQLKSDVTTLGCCLYHETIPSNYPVNAPPDPHLVHLSNGFNSCGGTMFLREPYLRYLAPDWNCKEVDPRGFDFSAHYLMYVHNLWMTNPDLARGMHLGFRSPLFPNCESGQELSFWSRYFGRSIWGQTNNAVVNEGKFHLQKYGKLNPVREPWMEAELLHRGLA